MYSKIKVEDTPLHWVTWLCNDDDDDGDDDDESEDGDQMATQLST